MAAKIYFDNATMKVGDVLEDYGGTAHVYLGYYLDEYERRLNGLPYCGYMYVKLGRLELAQKKDPLFWEKDAPKMILDALQNDTVRRKGNYRAAPKTFVRKIGEVDLDPIMHKLQIVWGRYKIDDYKYDPDTLDECLIVIDRAKEMQK